jgi:hypothetical protein
MLHGCEAVQCVVFDARVLFTPEAATKFTKESALDRWSTRQIKGR